MSSSPTCKEFLMTVTGLSSEQINALYDAGDPWPLWTSHDIRRAGMLAQAQALLFPDALNQIQAAIETQTNVIFSRFETDDIAYGSVSVAERFEILTSLPWLKESAEHIDRVAARTGASKHEVSLVSNAIQRYALLNPGWEVGQLVA